MKKLIFLISTIIIFSGCQNKNDETVDFSKNFLIGKIDGNNFQITVDKNILLEQVNSSLYPTKRVLNNVEILSSFTSGDIKEKFYFISFTSKETKVTVVRYLFRKDNNLFIENSMNKENFQFQDFFIGCEGNGSCFPKLFKINKDYIWACTDNPNCVSPEEAKKSDCHYTASVL